jgi:hypothetical protein
MKVSTVKCEAVELSVMDCLNQLRFESKDSQILARCLRWKIFMSAVTITLFQLAKLHEWREIKWRRRRQSCQMEQTSVAEDWVRSQWYCCAVSPNDQFQQKVSSMAIFKIESSRHVDFDCHRCDEA